MAENVAKGPVPPIMRYFEYSHLSQPLQEISAEFKIMAVFLDSNLPNGAEKSTALRKLLESKDCAVRAALDLISDRPR